jgi:hypothetical protein
MCPPANGQLSIQDLLTRYETELQVLSSSLLHHAEVFHQCRPGKRASFSRLDECEIIAGLQAAFLNLRAEL